MSVTDQLAKRVEALWKEYYPSATLLPVIGLPSTGGGVGFLTHTMEGHVMRINGLTSLSPLANNALYTFELSEGKYINLYETMIPDIPGKNGHKSTGQIYINALRDNGLDPNGIHFHWTGGSVYSNDKLTLAIHHSKIGMDPKEFSEKTIAALQLAMGVVEERAQMYVHEEHKVFERLTDKEARDTFDVWQKYLPDSLILPGIGLPSQNNGVLTLTHSYGNNKLLSINGLTSKSPLSNNGLYSAEKSHGKTINLYEILVPDIPGENGELSTAQAYIDCLEKESLQTSAIHFHWTGGTVYPQDKGVVAVHHYNIGLSPQEFSMRTIRALTLVNRIIEKRLAK